MSSAIVTGAIAFPALARGAASRCRVAKGAVMVRSITGSSRVARLADVPPSASAHVREHRAAWTVAGGVAIDSEVQTESEEVEIASKAPFTASATALSTLVLTAMPAMAEFDADGVPETSIVTTIFFTVAVLLLGVITVGILYLSAREALDRKEESDAVEEEERQARVIEANKNNKNFVPKTKKQKVTPSMQASGLNRRERRKKEREADDA